MANAELSAFLNDSESRRVMHEVDRAARVHRGNVRHAARACRGGRSSDVVLVDLDGDQNAISDVATLLQVVRPESVVLATGSSNNVMLANDLYRGGIFLYLPKPLNAVNLSNALREVAAASEENQRPQIQASRVVMVNGKGMGVNTVTGLLAHFAADQGRFVSCLDLDAHFGSLAFTLDTQPEPGLAEALQEPGNDDSIPIESLQARVTNRIGLLAYPVYDSAETGVARHRLDDLIRALSNYAHMILVCGASLEQVLAMRHLVTNQIIVFEPTPTGVSIATRWLRVLEGATSTLVMNHARPLPKLLAQEHLRDAFGSRLPDVEVPYVRSLPEAMARHEPASVFSRRQRDLLNRFLHSLLGVGSTDSAT